MRRFATAAVAAATAFSLAATPAAEAQNKPGDLQMAFDIAGKYLEQQTTGKQNFTPSIYGSVDREMKRQFETGETRDLSVLNSSLRNDAANDYKYGTTFDILLGTGIAAILLGGAAAVAFSQGLIKLPNF